MSIRLWIVNRRPIKLRRVSYSGLHVERARGGPGESKEEAGWKVEENHLPRVLVPSSVYPIVKQFRGPFVLTPCGSNVLKHGFLFLSAPTCSESLLWEKADILIYGLQPFVLSTTIHHYKLMTVSRGKPYTRPRLQKWTHYGSKHVSIKREQCSNLLGLVQPFCRRHCKIL